MTISKSVSHRIQIGVIDTMHYYIYTNINMRSNSAIFMRKWRRYLAIAILKFDKYRNSHYLLVELIEKYMDSETSIGDCTSISLAVAGVKSLDVSIPNCDRVNVGSIVRLSVLDAVTLSLRLKGLPKSQRRFSRGVIDVPAIYSVSMVFARLDVISVLATRFLRAVSRNLSHFSCSFVSCCD